MFGRNRVFDYCEQLASETERMMMRTEEDLVYKHPTVRKL